MFDRVQDAPVDTVGAHMGQWICVISVCNVFCLIGLN